MRRKRQLTTPDVALLEAELRRERKKTRFARLLRNTTNTLLVVAAISVLVATLLTPVLQIYGHSMTPTLHEGQFVVSIKGSSFQQGDLVSFYIGNKLLVKRYIAGPGQWVEIDQSGNVFVNSKPLDEPYLTEKALGDCNIEFPYQVPDNRIFCMGDHRANSLDSRNTAVGCISEEQIVGKIVFRVWPFAAFGGV
jgi:signal peptidase I